eukprot:TRINITY_DN69886_c0_g1_i1.p1 TRINITY_DN69886_c0_g1~~TRINITY_DN69886_c0_g1_i1.p1  ORF type:complete len:623 (+),score=98.11 TRINITY_DN69886_c0_g1_i1:172-2040(+)
MGVFQGQGSAAKQPPLLCIGPCSTLRQAGLLHGRAAAERIRALLDTEELRRTRAYYSCASSPDGAAAAFADLRADNAAAFPEYAAEIAGIAEGASVPVEDIWMVNLLAEVQALRGLPIGKRAEHCSDIVLRGSGNQLWHGHNEDFTEDPIWHENIYFVKYEATSEASFASVMGLCYPGMIPGFAMTWSSNGLMLTQNSLFPPSVHRRGLGCTFVARRALEEATFDGALLQLVAPGQALGASVNLFDVSSCFSACGGCRSSGGGGAPRACNIEVHGVGNTVAIQWLSTALGSTLLHFNVYSSLAVGNANNPRNSAARQARASALLVAAPSKSGGAADILSVLGDAHPKTAFPIFKPSTMASWLLDLESGTVRVWARSRPGFDPPLYTWQIDGFFKGVRVVVPSGTLVSWSSGGADGGVTPRGFARRPLPVHKGVHQADLRLRQEIASSASEARRSSRDCAAAMAEMNSLRKELLQRVKSGELSEEAAVQAFRFQAHRRLQVWPLQRHAGENGGCEGGGRSAGDDSMEGKRWISAHDVDLMLRKEVGHIMSEVAKSPEARSRLQPAALAALRRDLARRVCVGALSPDEACLRFRERAEALVAPACSSDSATGDVELPVASFFEV